MTQNPRPENPTDKAADASANTMNEPLPGSDGAVPNPTAAGFAEPIESAERATGVDPGTPTPTAERVSNQPENRSPNA